MNSKGFSLIELMVVLAVVLFFLGAVTLGSAEDRKRLETRCTAALNLARSAHDTLSIVLADEPCSKYVKVNR